MKLFSSFLPPFVSLLFKIVEALSNSAVRQSPCDDPIFGHTRSHAQQGELDFLVCSKSRHLHALVSNKFLSAESRNS